MIPFAVVARDITLEDLSAFKDVVRLVRELPDDPRLTCHSVARLAARVALGFRVVDGYFKHGYEHSWLRRDQTVIDCYPIAAASPLMVSIAGLSPWSDLYNEARSAKEKAHLAPALQTAKELIAELTR